MAARLKVIFGSFLKSAHRFWLEIIGALFFAFAAAFGLHAVKTFRADIDSAGATLSILGSSSLCILTLVFGIHSFWKARKLR